MERLCVQQPPVVLAAAIAVLAACPAKPSSSPTIHLTASSLSFQLGSMMVITLTASGTSDGQPWTGNSHPPTFSATWGTFAAGAQPDIREKEGDAITNGASQIQLFPDELPPSGGTFEVTSVYTDPSGREASATIHLTVSGSAIADLKFDCATHNIGAILDTSIAGIPCTAQALDANNNVVAGADIQFLAEAGSFAFDSQANTWSYQPFVSGPGNVPNGNGGPLDVPPLPNEPSEGDANPRDGLVTLVAYVTAGSAAVATNALSYAPYGGAPFVDADDSGAWHSGDVFIDVNHNGIYATGQHSILWKQIKLLWTAGVQSAPTNAVTWNGGAPDDPNIPYPGSGMAAFTVLDMNLNIVASNGPTDEISWSCTGSPPIMLLPPTAPMNSTLGVQGLGFQVDANYNILPGTSWGIGAQYSVTLQNDSTCTGTPLEQSFSCAGQITRTLWIDDTGAPQDTVATEQTLALSGTVDPCSSG